MKILDIFFTKNNISLSNIVHSYANEKFSYILSFQTLLVEIFVVFSFVSIPSFTKILFDITRYYSSSIVKERYSKKLEVDKLNLEKNFLLAQLNPHFLFNTFNNLYALALKKSDILPGIIEKLSDIMRYTVYDATAEKISILKEVDFIKNYIELEKIRHSNKSEIQLILSENIPNSQTIAPLLFFPFVENAFKYGLKSTKKFIKIFIDYDGFKMIFRIENDKLFKDENNLIGYNGIGITNIKNRLSLIYPNRYDLNIVNAKDSFKVELKIKL